MDSFSGTLSATDLRMSSTTVSHELTWTTHHDLRRSDYFPILIYIPSTNQHLPAQSKPQKWLLDRADWTKFNELCSTPYNEESESDINTTVCNCNNHIINAATDSIPRSSSSIKQKNVPWWNNDLKMAIKKRNSALQKY